MPSHGQKHENRRRKTRYQVSTTLSFIDANFCSSLFSPIEHQPKLCSAICPSNKCHRPSNECIIDADCGSLSSDLSTNHLLFDASFLPLFSFSFAVLRIAFGQFATRGGYLETRTDIKEREGRIGHVVLVAVCFSSSSCVCLWACLVLCNRFVACVRLKLAYSFCFCGGGNLDERV